MLVVNVRFQKIEIDNFSLKDSVATLKLFFNDGNNKALLFDTKLLDVEKDAHAIVNRVRQYEKELNQKNSYQNDTFLDSFVNVVLENEEAIEEKIKAYLRKVKDGVTRVKTHRSATGYLDIVNQIKGIKTSLE
ncbi:hypothetical protein HN587_01635 [Candidatus Woesearchaeota archaeon]|jgi:transcription termination factor NusB|nr:hypothetical protein [Candidatus Woesearchaeota archaeon]